MRQDPNRGPALWSKPSRDPSLLLAAALLVAACNGEDDRCIEHRSARDFDEPSRWGPTPREAIGHAAGLRSGILRWQDGGSVGTLTPAGGEAGLSLELTLHEDAAIAVDSEHVGDGRLACMSSFEIAGTLTLASDDGALQEQLEVELLASDGEFGGLVEGTVNLAGHDFAGALSWTPAAADGELFLRLSWIDDASGTARGWLIWGESALTEVDGNEVTGAGVGQVLAAFEATHTP